MKLLIEATALGRRPVRRLAVLDCAEETLRPREVLYWAGTNVRSFELVVQRVSRCRPWVVRVVGEERVNQQGHVATVPVECAHLQKHEKGHVQVRKMEMPD